MKKVLTCILILSTVYSCNLLANESSDHNKIPNGIGLIKNLNKSDDFFKDGPLIGYTTNNANKLKDIAKRSGRYRANLTDNFKNKTLHYKKSQGRLDAKRVAFPFEFIARNIGIGTQDDSQTSIKSTGGFNFAGVQVHVLDLDSRNSAHIVVGHRGRTGFTIEGKNTVNGKSTVDDIGANAAPLGRADIRIVGNVDRSLTIYWQQPNQVEENWQLYNGSKKGNGKLPGKQASFDNEVYVGLITYAQGRKGIPFIGTCDSIEIYE